MRSFDIGLSALRANQQSLAIRGNNIANATTPGYHRQRPEQAARAPLFNDPLRIGRGVDVLRISRLRSAAIENALLRNSSLISSSQGSLDAAVQVENIFAPNDGSVHANMSTFFSNAEMVANAPQDLTVRREFLASGSRLMENFRLIDQNLDDLSSDLVRELGLRVKAVNGLLADLAEVNERIRDADVSGGPPNNLLDRRDQLHLELTELIDVSVRTTPDGNETVSLASGGVIANTFPATLAVDLGSPGNAGVVLQPPGTSLQIAGGRIASLLDAINNVIPEMKSDVALLSGELVRAVDQQHATGIPADGPFQSLFGTRSVDSVSQPFELNADTFPVESGSLYITITEQSSGIRRTEKIDFDPAVDSLVDLASRLDAIPEIAASVDSGRRTISIASDSTHRFDFAGRPDNQPDLTAYSGSAVPTFSGRFTGAANDQWTVTFSGPGTIGVTDGLTATVRNSAGVIQAELDVGQGYEADTLLDVRDGVSLQFAAGDVAAPDSVSIYVLADSDETGLLSALGLNSLFEGTTPDSYRVRAEFLSAPETMAVSYSALPGDATNMAVVSDLRDIRSVLPGNQTYSEFIADLTANTGLAVNIAQDQAVQLTLFEEKLLSDRDAISGVDINEEMLGMMQLERSFQAAARFVSVLDQTLQEVLSIGR
jgi:flagellar hook-associated protein 1